MTQATVTVRKAAMRDIPRVLALINSYAANGIMLPRTEFEMSENIRDFSVAYDGEVLTGCGALHFYTPVSGEVRSLAVLPAGEAARNRTSSGRSSPPPRRARMILNPYLLSPTYPSSSQKSASRKWKEASCP